MLSGVDIRSLLPCFSMTYGKQLITCKTIIFGFMILISTISYSQEPVAKGVAPFAGWLYHANKLSLGTSYQPQSILHLNNGGDPSGPLPIFLQITNSYTGYTNQNMGFLMGIDNQYNILLNQQENANLSFYTNSIERLTILNTGQLKINYNPNPDYVLKCTDATGLAEWQALNDDDPNNEFQTISQTGLDISLSSGGGTFSVADNDNDANNEIITNTTLNGTSLEITEAGTLQSIDLISLQDGVNDADADPTNELQQLSIMGGQLTISGGNAIEFSNLNYWSKTNDEIYYNSGNVGIGTETPFSNLHIHASADNQTSSSKSTSTPPPNGGGYPVSIGTSRLQITSDATGSSLSDGLIIKTTGNNAIVDLQEEGYFSIETDNKLRMIAKPNGNIGIGILTPQNILHVHSDKTENNNNNGNGEIGLGTKGLNTQNSISAIQITNNETGITSGDGLLLQTINNTGIINLQENADFKIITNNETRILIKPDGKIGIKNTAPNADLDVKGTFKVRYGTIINEFSTDGTLNDNSDEAMPTEQAVKTYVDNQINNIPADNLGNHIAEQNLNMDGYNINFNDENACLTIHQNTTSSNGPAIEMYGRLHSNTSRQGRMNFISYDDKGDFGFYNYNNGTWKNKMIIKSDGKVGIGTDNPVSLLQIGKTDDISAVLTISGGETGSEGGEIKLSMAADYDDPKDFWRIDAYEDKLRFGPQGATNVTFLANGNVGIGTNTPSTKLEVKDGSIYIHGSSSGQGRLVMKLDNSGNQFEFYPQSSGLFLFDRTSNLYRLVVLNDGNVGIGTTNPQYKLVVSGSQSGYNYANIVSYSNGDQIGFGLFNDTRKWELINIVSSSTDYFAIRDQTAQKNRLIIDQNGNVSFNNTAKIHSNGYIWAKEVKVRDTNPYPDFVFKDDYKLKTIEELGNYIDSHNHLPDVPTEADVNENGMELGKMNKILLQKIEELTLYVIDLQKQINLQNNDIETLKK